MEGEVAQGFRISIRANHLHSIPEFNPHRLNGGPDWKAVKRIVNKQDSITAFGRDLRKKPAPAQQRAYFASSFARTPEVAAAYEARAAKDLEKYLTIGDELHCRLFGDVEAVDPKSGKTIAAQVAASETALVLQRNNFPYILNEKVKHFVLWTRGQLDTFRTKDIRRIVSSNLGIGKKHVLAYKQPEGLNSVPNVSHWQIFVRAKALPKGFQEDQPILISNMALSKKVQNIKQNRTLVRALLVVGGILIFA